MASDAPTDVRPLLKHRINEWPKKVKELRIEIKNLTEIIINMIDVRFL